MNIEISKRKLESYKRAEMVCQELRYQIANNANKEDLPKVCQYLLYWKKIASNKICYERPKEIKKQ